MRFLALLVVLLFPTGSLAQMADPSFKLDVGVGGGVSFPMSDLSNRTSRGWNVGLKTRLHGFSPLQVALGAHYNSLPLTSYGFFTGRGSLQHWIFNGGLEIPVPVGQRDYPYFSFGALLAAVENTGSFITTSSGGLEVGVGIVEPFAPRSTIDFDLKYQWMNLFGKDKFDGDFNQIQLMGHLMVGVVR